MELVVTGEISPLMNAPSVWRSIEAPITPSNSLVTWPPVVWFWYTGSETKTCDRLELIRDGVALL